MRKILAVYGSARRKGNSDALLDRALEGIRTEEPDVRVDVVIPHEISIIPCRSCGACRRTGRCVIHDDMERIYALCESCDHIIVAAPVYFTSVPGHLKVLVDRFQCYWARRKYLGEPPQPRRAGMFLCTASLGRESFYGASLSVIKTWMMELNMACAVSRFYPKLEDRQDALKRADYLEDARQAAHELLAWKQG